MNKLQIKPVIKQKVAYTVKSKPIITYSCLKKNSNSTKKKVYSSKTGSKRITHAKEAFICYGVGCLVIGGVIGLFSSLMGHTYLEQSRREQLRIKEKVINLKREIGQLKGKIDEIKYHENIDRWAESKGMINNRLVPPKAEELAPQNLLKDAYVASF